MRFSPPALRTFVLLATPALAGLAGACSSGGPKAGPACDPCEAGTPVMQAPALNPDGIAYPSPAGGYGHKPRSGKTPGNVISNLRFEGYVNGDYSKGLQVVSLADYYDPCVRRLKLLHLSVAGVWCKPCNDETTALVAAKAQLDADQVVVLQALSDGPNEGVGATQTDLTYWVTHHNVTFTEVLDPGPTQFGGFFAANAIPWNADVDPRTMEIIDAASTWGGDVMAAVQGGLNAVGAAPSYPVPTATCSDQ